MPFKSEAQKRKIAELEAQGKVPKGTYSQWEKETPSGKLPERLTEKPNGPRKASRR
jgi:hypothetical protein